MKIRRKFRCFSPNGYEVCPNEGDIIPVGWSIEQCDEDCRTVTSEESVVIGTTADISNPYDGGPEIWVRTLSVRTASQNAAIAAAAAADIIGHAEAARLTAIITDAGIVGLSVKWDTYYAYDKVGLRMGRDLVTESSIRGNLAYWLERQQAAAAKAAAKVAAAAEAAIWIGMPDVVALTQAEFLRCGWKSAEQGRLTMTGGPDPDHIPVDGVMYLFRRDVKTEGYNFLNQGRGGFVATGHHHFKTVVVPHPRYDAAISAARAAWASKTAITSDSLLSVIRTSMGDIVTPIAPPPPTQEEILAKQAEELAVQKAANAARRQASRDAEAAELAAKKAARLKRYSEPAAEAPAAEASPSSSVNLNDPWGSLSALKL